MIAGTILIVVSIAPSLAAAPPEEVLNRALGYYQSGRLNDAARAYTAALADLPDEPAMAASGALCRRQLLDIYRRLRRHGEAIATGRALEAQLVREPDRNTSRRWVAMQIGESFRALGHADAAGRCFKQALEIAENVPLHPLDTLNCAVRLAELAERTDGPAAAGPVWQKAVQTAEKTQAEFALTLTEAESVAVRIQWAYCTGKLGDFETAIQRLRDTQASFARRGRLADWRLQRDVLLALSDAYRSRRDYAAAADSVAKALRLVEQAEPTNAMRIADLLSNLGELTWRRGERSLAMQQWERAATLYRQIIESFKSINYEALDAVDAFWKLERLYRDSEQFSLASQLVASYAESWSAEPLRAAELKTEDAALRAALGDYARSRPLLAEALAFRERQSPLDLEALPRTINSLAFVEQASGNLPEAQRLARRAIALYTEHRLPADADRAEAESLLAVVALTQGEYARAIDHLRRGIDICRQVGPAADGQRCNLLLNLAIVQRSQGELAQAIRTCLEGWEVYQSWTPDARSTLTAGAFYAALASLHAAHENFADARRFAELTLDICRRHSITSGPLVVAAKHCLALDHLAHRRLDKAAMLWEEILASLREAGQKSFQMRVLNYLGVVAEARREYAKAQERYRQALAIDADTPKALPITRFITLWKLAELAGRHGDPADARKLLRQAAEVADAVRAGTFGGERLRARSFAQFAPVFDDLVELALGEKNFDEAIYYAELSRNRTFLDQLQIVGVDPRRDLEGTPDAQRWLPLEAELRNRMSQIRLQARLLPPGDDDSVRKLAAELAEIQRQFEDVWSEILSASPTYRDHLGKRQNIASLEAIRKRILGPKAAMLFYYVGREKSYLVLLGPGETTPEAFTLAMSSANLERLTALSQPSQNSTVGTHRGVIRIRKPPRRYQPPPIAPGQLVPLDQQLAGVLVEGYLERLQDPEFANSRALVTTTASKKGTMQSETALGEVLLPPALRARLRELAPEYVIVVPDGALHKLPFEALLLEGGRFALDELPPLVYAPSATVLATLSARQREEQRPLALLTVGNPQYDRAASTSAARLRGGLDLTTILGERGQFPMLPATSEECKRVSALFAGGQTAFLELGQATERNVADKMRSAQVVHLAAHGFVLGDLFGGIALTPGATGAAPDDDGILQLHEISSIPLSGCELAVLSACMTVVGEDVAQEAGFSLARTFLTAGARRVVASHWNVADESTAELMGVFFAEFVNAAKAGRPINYALALQTARKQLRQSEKFSAPFFWAPFVLLGPAEGP